ncbi:sigma-54-dependent Fis family transcriptional regulator [Flavobacterium selenitireducens]|uniref:sigma-54-dependent Fis family transcriptional regulator n=1 Tax=Flavobacterium selenitireducens TaxID=2722704 RepID=UPI00168A937E|nr:sigma 54-interacting transcriptional regulator [Flavobacterium selenitireducens]MBD3581816.1 sigma 54-interacting transcriptional regulator [Flavobacterium selenitireducens]
MDKKQRTTQKNATDNSSLEQQSLILLDLAKDITKVREKNDLIILFTKRIRAFFEFTHTIVTLIDPKDETYTPFLLDNERSPIRDHDAYDGLTQSHFNLNEPFIKAVLASDGPVSFYLNDVMDQPQSPSFLKVNYDRGVREILMATLWNEEKPMGFIHIYSNNTKTFTEEFRNIIKGIAPQLSVAVSNIIKNEELQKKESEKSFLLDFSQDVAAVRDKNDLQAAVRNALSKLNSLRGYVIRKINDDNQTMSTYLYDTSLEISDQALLSEVLQSKFPIDDGLQNRVLESYIPLLFNIDIEINRGVTSKYLKLWKQVGFRSLVGIALRHADVNLGILWLATDEVNVQLLKGICAQISTAMANIIANEKVLLYKQQLEQENVYLKEQIKSIYNFSDIIGSGEAMQIVYRLMSLVADSNSTVLVLGETGTGKELIARAVHNASPRKDRLMIKVNCAAMPANLIESELFGHEKGAFTGAVERRIGKFELANNSTLFLDEIGEMPLEAQVKLLRVLQERELERVGGKDTIKVDVRIIAATNRDLDEEVKAGRFRSDLFYRLNVFPIELPPLRDRMEDIEALANFFVSKYNKNSGRHITRISPAAFQQLRSYLWPGNVRELEHLIERSVLMASDNTLREVYIPKRTDSNTVKPQIFDRTYEQMERDFIISTLKRCRGKISGPGSAAEVLDIPGNTLHSKMKKLKIEKADYFKA